MASLPSSSETKSRRGPYQPTLIIHGGAGAIKRENLPPELYDQYRKNLASYLTQTKKNLDDGASALDAACFAVSLLEDDPLFNCGRGSVFTVSGHIEMEASVMVTSVAPTGSLHGGIKRTGAVSRIRNTRHPIQLARQVLLRADASEGRGPIRDMHCHLNGHLVEEWGWLHYGLEAKEDNWFWTQKRWDEHRRGLERGDSVGTEDSEEEESPLPSQGTVGCVCFDSHGDLAVATSTGGLTNKLPGRVGDTPTVGAGFWAESWEQQDRSSEYVAAAKMRYSTQPASALSTPIAPPLLPSVRGILDAWRNCMPSLSPPSLSDYSLLHTAALPSLQTEDKLLFPLHRPRPLLRRAIALSGTGNGDSFLRVAAARTVGAQCRFADASLERAVTQMAGPGGELQRSAENRWGIMGEGEGGIIGIEADQRCKKAHVVADFNCGGMWRAWFDDVEGKDVVRVRVFRDGDDEDGDDQKGGSVK